MTRSRNLAAAALVLATLGACSKVTYVNPRATPTPFFHHTKGHFFIGGLVGEKRIPVYQMCPQGAYWIQSKHTAIDVIAHLFTFFIYTPRTYVIQCGQTGGAR